MSILYKFLRILFLSSFIWGGITISLVYAGDDDIAGLLTIKVQLDNAVIVQGHAWIEYKPLIPVDGIDIITLGTWDAGIIPTPNVAPTRRGVNINYEIGSGWDISRSKYITFRQFRQAADKIRYYLSLGEDAWGYYENCSVFASDVWFAGTGEFLDPRYYDSYALYYVFPPAPQNLFYSILDMNEDKVSNM